MFKSLLIVAALVAIAFADMPAMPTDYQTGESVVFSGATTNMFQYMSGSTNQSRTDSISAAMNTSTVSSWDGANVHYCSIIAKYSICNCGTTPEPAPSGTGSCSQVSIAGATVNGQACQGWNVTCSTAGVSSTTTFYWNGNVPVQVIAGSSVINYVNFVAGAVDPSVFTLPANCNPTVAADAQAFSAAVQKLARSL